MTESRILDLVDLCYQAVETPVAWQRVVTEFTDILSADACDFAIEDYETGVATAMGSVGFDPGFRVDYDFDFLGENGWIEALKQLPLGRAFGSQLEPEDFERSPYYNEWVRPQGFRHAIGALLENSGSRAIHFGMLRYRDREVFDAGDAQFIDRVLPHLHRSVHLRGRLEETGPVEGALPHLVESLQMPAFLLDTGARVVDCNTAAERLVRRSRDLCVNRAILRLWLHAADQALKAALVTASRIEMLAQQPGRCEIILPRRDAAVPALLIDVIPLRFGAVYGRHGALSLVIVVDPGADLPDTPEILSRIWGLTQTEARLALALANGVSPAEFAEQAGTGIGTVRWHLKNAEAKLGVSSIAGLTAMVQGALRRA